MDKIMNPKTPETEEDETVLPPSQTPEDPGQPHDDGTLFSDGTGYE